MSAPSKQYVITFTELSEYLYADVKAATISEEIIHGYMSELLAKSGETGKQRILLVRDIPAVLSGGQVFFTVNESLDALKGKQLAVVNPHPAIKTAIEFGITVGQNRGGHYQCFDNVTDAEEWLLKGIE